MRAVTLQEQPTCGQGLAANAVLPAKLAEVLAARAEVLERHMQALDRADPNAQPELDAYANLARAHRGAASELSRLAHEMAGCRDLPMARHDLAVMANPEGQLEAFRRFVAVERELLAVLQANLEQEERLLR
jgi:HPt (histidine-containing phosphotransfer) domain-containing protein